MRSKKHNKSRFRLHINANKSRLKGRRLQAELEQSTASLSAEESAGDKILRYAVKFETFFWQEGYCGDSRHRRFVLNGVKQRLM